MIRRELQVWQAAGGVSSASSFVQTENSAASSSAMNAKGQEGLALSELRVVLALVAILAAMLLPPLAKAKAMAKRIRYFSQMRRVGLV